MQLPKIRQGKKVQTSEILQNIKYMYISKITPLLFTQMTEG